MQATPLTDSVEQGFKVLYNFHSTHATPSTHSTADKHLLIGMVKCVQASALGGQVGRQCGSATHYDPAWCVCEMQNND